MRVWMIVYKSVFGWVSEWLMNHQKCICICIRNECVLHRRMIEIVISNYLTQYSCALPSIASVDSDSVTTVSLSHSLNVAHGIAATHLNGFLLSFILFSVSLSLFHYCLSRSEHLIRYKSSLNLSALIKNSFGCLFISTVENNQ